MNSLSIFILFLCIISILCYNDTITIDHNLSIVDYNIIKKDILYYIMYYLIFIIN